MFWSDVETIFFDFELKFILCSTGRWYVVEIMRSGKYTQLYPLILLTGTSNRIEKSPTLF